MKQKTEQVFTQKDEQIIDLFADLGMPKNLAKTLMFISHVEDCRSTDIETGAELLQPQVSVAVQELRRRGWITKHDIKKKGKGRPVHHYKLTASLPSLLKSFESEKIQEVEAVKKNLSELERVLLS